MSQDTSVVESAKSSPSASAEAADYYGYGDAGDDYNDKKKMEKSTTTSQTEAPKGTTAEIDYGYSYEADSHPTVKIDSQDYGYGYETDSHPTVKIDCQENSTSETAGGVGGGGGGQVQNCGALSKQRSRRRNSCLIRKDQDPLAVAEFLMGGPPRMSDRDMKSDQAEISA